MQKKSFLLLIIFIFFSIKLFPQNSLNKNIYDIINESVFEIVLKKINSDSLKYEKPLPYNLLPFSVRNDDYISIGTAFAISQITFMSAAHVFFLENESQYNNFYIRDKQGKVYEIDQIIKYSNLKDYILFTVKDLKVNKTLKINYNIEINEPVYAVGNALGEGIIIRDGVLTSLTLEKENGQWEWLRFSAAASPGNSGGPLLDKNGDIIGIITMKSPNENLNYALQLKEIHKDRNNLAIFKQKLIYSLPNMTKKKPCKFDYQSLLPKNYLDLKKEVSNKFLEFTENTLKSLLTENNETIFPKGKGSLNLLHTVITSTFPRIISEGEDGNWDAYIPKETKTSDLSNNGFIQYGNMMGIDLIYFNKPDDFKLVDLYQDSKLFMDLILKGIAFNRKFMNQDIRISSLGKAHEEYDYFDSYKRKWLVKTWLLEYMDSKLLSFSLVIPNGLISLIKIAQTGNINSGYLQDMKVLTDFIYLSYYGSFNQWSEFFENKEYLPEVLQNIDFFYEKDKKLNFKSNNLTFEINNKFFEISDKSYMYLQLTYIKENKEVVWDIGSIIVGEHKDNKNFFSIFKKIKPEEGLKDVFINDWNKLINKQFPYNNSAQQYEGSTFIYKLHDYYENKNKNDLNYIYFTFLGMEGNISENKMKKKIKDINSIIKIKE